MTTAAPKVILKYNTLERIRAHCGMTASGCWIWHGKRSDRGYALQATSRAGGTPRKYIRMARFVWELKNGRPMDKNLKACHSCDTPACVNPDHIEPATQKRNLQDVYTRGLRPRRLTDEQVREIRAAPGPVTKEMQHKYKSQPQVLERIRQRTLYIDVPDKEPTT